MPSWDADLYLTFASERAQPVFDLVSRIALPAPRRIIDLGCGPGNSTEVLWRRWPDAEVVGLDSSPEMIAAATKAHPGRRWLLEDVAAWRGDETFDLVFSNATFQWVPGQEELFPRLFARVAPGGALAVQVPAHLRSAVHRCMIEVSERPEWRDRLEAARRAIHVHEPGFYYDLLCDRASRLDLWVTVYQHVLAGPEAIVEWMSGTGLRPFLEALTAEEQPLFRAAVLEGVEASYPRRKDGRVLFPFRRLFLVAYRGG
jgi:trans-aconitate 2-methyltransferase